MVNIISSQAGLATFAPIPLPASPMFTPAYAVGDAWDHNGRTL